MTLARKTQIALVLTTSILFVLLFLAPKTNSGKQPENKATESNVAVATTLDSFLNSSVKSLTSEDKIQYERLLKTANQSHLDTSLIPVIHFWDKLKRPDLASYFVEKIAEKVQSSEGYSKAGDRYYFSIKFCKDEAEIETLFQSAMRCYTKSIELNPKNVNSKIQLAACYVENGKDPMKGIALLREVEKIDSTNIKLQLTFAFFSVKSGQIDKAIKRFNKVLDIDPLYIEAYLHLADAYEQQGDKNKTISMLTKYASLTDDAMAKQEVLKYIEQLKK